MPYCLTNGENKMKPVYERFVHVASGMPAFSFLSLEPEDDADEPVGYLTQQEDI